MMGKWWWWDCSFAPSCFGSSKFTLCIYIYIHTHFARSLVQCYYCSSFYHYILYLYLLYCSICLVDIHLSRQELICQTWLQQMGVQLHSGMFAVRTAHHLQLLIPGGQKYYMASCLLQKFFWESLTSWTYQYYNIQIYLTKLLNSTKSIQIHHLGHLFLPKQHWLSLFKKHYVITAIATKKQRCFILPSKKNSFHTSSSTELTKWLPQALDPSPSGKGSTGGTTFTCHRGLFAWDLGVFQRISPADSAGWLMKPFVRIRNPNLYQTFSRFTCDFNDFL